MFQLLYIIKSDNQVEYIDLLAFHGVNSPKELDWVVRPGGCWEVHLLLLSLTVVIVDTVVHALFAWCYYCTVLLVILLVTMLFVLIAVCVVQGILSEQLVCHADSSSVTLHQAQSAGLNRCSFKS
jgi:hypothetical protein